MHADDFIQRKRSSWERLSALLDRAGVGIAALSADEIQELGRLYRQASSDLAAARRDFPRHQVSAYLNGLVARGHGAIYHDTSGRAGRTGTFLRSTFPRTFRDTWAFTLAAFLMFLLPAIAAFIITYRDPTLGSVLVPGAEQVITNVEAGNEWWQRINEEGRSLSSAEIMTNNIGVAFRAFAGGVTFGVYTLVVLATNGLMLGVVAGAAQRFSFAANLWGFVAAHGVIELSVIFIAGGAGLQLGWALLHPGLLTRRAALVLAARRAVLLLLGCVPLLVIAGVIEAFISPSALPLAVKLLVAFGSGIALYTYLLGAGRS
ncbi:stage II sporulation protein M [Chloroflexales bacterium ZM16-3]|nr:stage II sporulation protein M [Chloroflexales bacterium ZM16-3]